MPEAELESDAAADDKGEERPLTLKLTPPFGGTLDARLNVLL